MLQSVQRSAESIAQEIDRLLTLASDVLSDPRLLLEFEGAIEIARSTVHRETARDGQDDGFLVRARELMLNAMDGTRAFGVSRSPADFHQATRMLKYAGFVLRYALVIRCGATAPLPTWPDVPRSAGWRSVRADRVAQTSNDTLLWIDRWQERLARWETPGDRSAVEEPLHAYRQAVEALLRQGLTAQRLQVVVEAARDLRPALDECLVVGPTWMPMVNRVLNLSVAVEGGWYRVEVLMHYLRMLTEDLELEAAHIEDRVKGSESPSLVEQAAVCNALYGQLLQGLDLLGAGLRGQKNARAQGEEIILEAAAGLNASQATLSNLGLMEGKCVCLHCGQLNVVTQHYCDGCGAHIKASQSTLGPTCVSLLDMHLSEPNSYVCLEAVL